MFDDIAEEQDVLQSTATETRKRKRRPGKCHTCFWGQRVLCTIKRNDKL